jgi:hypothetical protein
MSQYGGWPGTRKYKKFLAVSVLRKCEMEWGVLEVGLIGRFVGRVVIPNIIFSSFILLAVVCNWVLSFCWRIIPRFPSVFCLR